MSRSLSISNFDSLKYQNTEYSKEDSSNSRVSKSRKKLGGLGRYSYETIKNIKDYKSVDKGQNKLLKDYRSNIEKILTEVKVTPITQPSHLREVVQQLRADLAEIEDQVDVLDPVKQMETASKYNPSSKSRLVMDKNSEYSRNMTLSKVDPPYVFSDILSNKKKAIEYEDESYMTALMPYDKTQLQYRITKKQHKNLQRIFKFYSTQHKLSYSDQTFDQVKERAGQVLIGDYLKFCKDFEMPISKEEQVTIYRKQSLRKGFIGADFTIFQEILKEIFSVKETIDLIKQKQKEIKVLTESNLSWNMDKRNETIAFVEKLKSGKRDTTRDHIYLSQAHGFLNTHDATIFLKKVKSVQFPFQSIVNMGEKLEDHSFLPTKPAEGAYIPEQRTKIGIVDNYSSYVSTYFKDKSDLQKKELSNIKQKSNTAAEKVQANRRSYAKLKTLSEQAYLSQQDTSYLNSSLKPRSKLGALTNGSKLGGLKSLQYLQNLSGNTFITQQVGEKPAIRNGDIGKPPKSRSPPIKRRSPDQQISNLSTIQQELQYQKEQANKDQQVSQQKTSNVSWFSLKKINYRFKEEQDISELLGIDVRYQNVGGYHQPPFESGGQGTGGGGQPFERRNRSIENIGEQNSTHFNDARTSLYSYEKSQQNQYEYAKALETMKQQITRSQSMLGIGTGLPQKIQMSNQTTISQFKDQTPAYPKKYGIQNQFSTLGDPTTTQQRPITDDQSTTSLPQIRYNNRYQQNYTTQDYNILYPNYSKIRGGFQSKTKHQSIDYDLIHVEDDPMVNTGGFGTSTDE